MEHTACDRTDSARYQLQPMASPYSQLERDSKQNQRSTAEERPVTMWPAQKSASPKSQPDTTSHMVHQQCFERKSRKERSTPKYRDIEAQRPRRKPVPKASATRPPSTLRRKSNFTEGLKACFGSPKSIRVKEPENRKPLSEIRTVKDAIRAGYLEIAIPPPRASKVNRQAAPPPPMRWATPPKIASSEKTNTQPNTFGDFLDRSADAINDMRRELIGKFKPPFEHLSYPSLSHPGRKSPHNSEASEISFCCIGEPEPEPSREIQALKTRQRQNSRRQSYEGGRGTDPWVHPPPKTCRLCKNPGVRGIRGLCNVCENDFIRMTSCKRASENSEDDEIRPTPPLKDVKSLTARQMQELDAKREFVSYPTLEKKQWPRPHGSARTELSMTNADSYPPVINSIQLPAQKGVIDGDDDERFRSEQTMPLEDEYERMNAAFRNWSDCSETAGCQSLGMVGGSAPRVSRDQMRDSEFYVFYHDLLDEHRATSTLRR